MKHIKYLVLYLPDVEKRTNSCGHVPTSCNFYFNLKCVHVVSVLGKLVTSRRWRTIKEMSSPGDC